MESAYVDNLEEKIRRKIVRQKRINTIHKLNKVPQRQYIMTSRFNNRTYAEMKAYCQTTRAIKSIYGVPREITHHVSRDSILFVLEMNATRRSPKDTAYMKTTPTTCIHM